MAGATPFYMALIAMACHSTESNGRAKYTIQALTSLLDTVDFKKHRLGVYDNGSCKEVTEFYKEFRQLYYNKFGATGKVIEGKENIGTAQAINQVWRLREAGEHAIKIDDDIIIHEKGWVEQLEEVVTIDSSIGQAACKRNDLWENTEHENPFYRTTLYQLPHTAGQRWYNLELTSHCMGSCVLHSSALLDKVGYLLQPSKYGGDDSLMSYRSQKAGFKNCFLSHIQIEHLETTPLPHWQAEKEKMFNDVGAEYFRLRDGITDGSIPYYYNPYQ